MSWGEAFVICWNSRGLNHLYADAGFFASYGAGSAESDAGATA